MVEKIYTNNDKDYNDTRHNNKINKRKEISNDIFHVGIVEFIIAGTKTVSNLTLPHNLLIPLLSSATYPITDHSMLLL